MKNLLSLFDHHHIAIPPIHHHNLNNRAAQKRPTTTTSSLGGKFDEQFAAGKNADHGTQRCRLSTAPGARNNDKDFDLASLRKKNKRIILINNGIHPGEPDGIDASMLLVRDIVANKIKLPDNIVLAIIPVYNIGGCLNRSAFYRVDKMDPTALAPAATRKTST